MAPARGDVAVEGGHEAAQRLALAAGTMRPRRSSLGAEAERAPYVRCSQ